MCSAAPFRWHDDVIKLKHFPRNWPFVRGIHRSRWIPRTKPVTRSFDVFFDLRLNKRLNKQSWGWWFETLSLPLWRHCNGWSRFLITSRLPHDVIPYYIRDPKNLTALQIITHWGRDKIAAIFQMTFSNAFSWMKTNEFRLRFHWSLFVRVQQATGLDAWASRVKCPARFVSHLHDICIYMSCS